MTAGWVCSGAVAVVCAGLTIWLVRLSSENDVLVSENKQLSEDNEAYKLKVERLLDDVTTLAKQVPKHGANGRFVKRG